MALASRDHGDHEERQEEQSSSQVGDDCLRSLQQKTDAPKFYRLVNSQGRFLDGGKGWTDCSR